MKLSSVITDTPWNAKSALKPCVNYHYDIFIGEQGRKAQTNHAFFMYMCALQVYTLSQPLKHLKQSASNQAPIKVEIAQNLE